MELREYLEKVVKVPDAEWAHLAAQLRPVVLQKGEYFFRQGEPSSDTGFVIEGLLCNFYSDAEGVDYVKKFSAAGSPVASYAGMMLGRPSYYSCQALEPTRLLTLKFSALLALYDRHPCWEKFGRLTAERLYLEKELREQEFLVDDAKTRFENFKKQRPELQGRIPQYLIASYLGVTPVSLSRLKN